MILSFTHKGLRTFYKTGSTKGIDAKHAEKISIVLDLLNACSGPDELITIRSLKMHKLTGTREGFWSVIIQGPWRIIFRFEGQNVEKVDYLNYH